MGRGFSFGPGGAVELGGPPGGAHGDCHNRGMKRAAISGSLGLSIFYGVVRFAIASAISFTSFIWVHCMLDFPAVKMVTVPQLKIRPGIDWLVRTSTTFLTGIDVRFFQTTPAEVLIFVALISKCWDLNLQIRQPYGTQARPKKIGLWIPIARQISVVTVESVEKIEMGCGFGFMGVLRILRLGSS